MSGLHQLRSHRIGLALSGGSVRGLAHIGVVKVLFEAGIRPAVITGTSAGSLIGAMFAAGMEWSEIASLARKTFWPKLLHGETLERFCAEHLPATFADLQLPFAAITTELPAKRTVIITKGELASAISASCALRGVRRPVSREGKRLKDGGIACVLPSEACRAMGADFIVGSDVWEFSSLLRGFGIDPNHPRASRTYPSHYCSAVRSTDLLIHPRVPLSGYLPGPLAIERMISAGEDATRLALSRFTAQAA
jgi:NTE family protein